MPWEMKQCIITMEAFLFVKKKIELILQIGRKIDLINLDFKQHNLKITITFTLRSRFTSKNGK